MEMIGARAGAGLLLGFLLAGPVLSAPSASTAAPKIQGSLCEARETVVMVCRSRRLVFALCGMNAPDRKYVVYRERIGKGAVVQIPRAEQDYSRELRLSTIGASGWQDRIHFRSDGVDYYVVDAMSKGGPRRDANGWPANGSGLVAVGAGVSQKFHNCQADEHSSIGPLAYDLIPREEFDEDVK